jgi:hypothetical protein
MSPDPSNERVSSAELIDACRRDGFVSLRRIAPHDVNRQGVRTSIGVGTPRRHSE